MAEEVKRSTPPKFKPMRAPLEGVVLEAADLAKISEEKKKEKKKEE